MTQMIQADHQLSGLLPVSPLYPEMENSFTSNSRLPKTLVSHRTVALMRIRQRGAYRIRTGYTGANFRAIQRFNGSIKRPRMLLESWQWVIGACQYLLKSDGCKDELYGFKKSHPSPNSMITEISNVFQ